MQPLNALNGPVSVNNLNIGNYYYIKSSNIRQPTDYLAKILEKNDQTQTLKVLFIKWRNPNNLQDWRDVVLIGGGPNDLPTLSIHYPFIAPGEGSIYSFFISHQQGGKRTNRLRKSRKVRKTKKAKKVRRTDLLSP
jgi:hypothetical protein